MSLNLESTRSGTHAAKRVERKQRRHAQRRDGILRAARNLLVTEGIENFTVSAVAALAQVSKPAVYYYFASKEQLITALAQHALEGEALVLAARVGAADTGLNAVEALVRGYCEHYASDPDSFRILYIWTRVLGISRAVENSDGRALQDRVNEELFEKLSQDQIAGRVPAQVNPEQIVKLARATAHGLVSEATLRWGLASGAKPDPTNSQAELEQVNHTHSITRFRAQTGVPAGEVEAAPEQDPALRRGVTEACRALRAYAAEAPRVAAIG